MAGNLEKLKAFGPFFTVVWSFLLASIFVSAERSLKQESLSRNATAISTYDSDSDLLSSFVSFMWQANKSGYHHVWPDLKFNWQIVIGSIIGFFGAAFGSVGMIMGAAASTVYYNLKLRHPTLDMPIIDYDLAVLIQPMLMLGISIGVAFNVVFADWMVTVLLIILFIGTSTKAFFKGVETWKKETILKKEAVKRTETNGEAEYKLLPGGPSNNTQTDAKDFEEPEIIKIPVSLGVSGYEAVSLYKGWRKLGSKGEAGTNFKVHQLLIYGFFGILAGMVGGLLGLGGGFIMGPLFLELGVPPQVSSATATFAMMFSSSMSVVEYYLLKRFPVPYAMYFVAVATVAAFIGQHVVRKMIIVMGRASIIIFILAFTIFVSAISLGGVGISNMIGKFQRHEYMGFENLCKYEV
ncbi:hypothetical protein DH2020_001952 [Rehmannia glutinosa]|uniref:Sulfite exporter TauE/SafE family protein n=1 Tax=Rehmannia glutinosa TaxID=99300 RepID=A0ABR0XSC5_REHGL